MAITNGYCTLNEFKAWLTSAGQTISTSATDDAVLEQIIEASSRFIDGETCRKFWKNEVAEARYYTAVDATYVRVDDLVSVTALYTDEGDRTYPNLWAATDFDLWPYNASIDGKPYVQIKPAVNGDYWFPLYLEKGVKVTGVFGYPSVPAQIKEACMMISLSTDKRRFGENISSVSTITAGGIVITPQDVPSLAWAKLNPFRKRI